MLGIVNVYQNVIFSILSSLNVLKYVSFFFSRQIGVAYASATTTATIVSVALNSLTKVVIILFNLATFQLICYLSWRKDEGKSQNIYIEIMLDLFVTFE